MLEAFFVLLVRMLALVVNSDSVDDHADDDELDMLEEEILLLYDEEDEDFDWL